MQETTLEIDLLRLLAVLLLVLANGYFIAAEFSLVNVRQRRIWRRRARRKSDAPCPMPAHRYHAR